MSDRPKRVQIKDELGKFKSLAAGPDEFETWSRGRDALFLGLGPDPAEAVKAAGKARTVRYLVSPSFEGQMPPGWGWDLPESWRAVSPDELYPELIAASRVIVYRQVARHFPSFWGPILARVRLALIRRGAEPPVARTALLPVAEGDLLAEEVASSLTRAGFEALRLEPGECAGRLPEILAQERPSLFFCVNFRGLDPAGEAFYLLKEAGVPTAVWLVDNPFHLLSGLRSPYWREAALFVTDASFIPLLARHGAARVFHLPLATDPAVMGRASGGEFPTLSERLVFVGRSEFPDKDKFFAGLTVPEAILAEARDLIRKGGRPDYSWWLGKLDFKNLWPGTGARSAGLGAETSAREFRASVLGAAGDLPLTVFGDPGWRELLPGIADLRAPVDYYIALPGIYASSGLSLNVTSLLLPAGLTQRHFDVWAAGGALITDDTPGLSIFPKELTREITFKRPADLPELARRLLGDRTLRRDLTSAWRKLILAGHTFDKRIESVLDALRA